MPIVVVCPGCGAKLNAPDAAAGKRVKCPRPNCGMAVPVPAAAPEPAAELPVAPPQPQQSSSFDFDDDEPKQTKKPVRKAEPAEDEDEDRPVKKKRAVDEDEEDSRPKKKRRAAEEDDDDEDDRPTRRRRKQKASGISPVVIGAIVLGGLLVLGGMGYGIYALTKKSDDTASSGSGGSGGSGTGTPEKPKGKVPEKWVEYTSAQDKFKMTMPPQVKKTRPSSGKGNQYQAVDTSTFLMTLVHVLDIPPGIPPEKRKELENGVFEGLVDKNTKADRRQVLFKGKMVDEVSMDVPTKERKDGLDFKPRMVVRVVHGEAKLYLVCVMAMQGAEGLKDADAIFDTFQIVN